MDAPGGARRHAVGAVPPYSKAPTFASTDLSPVDASTSRVSGSAPAVGHHDDSSQAEPVVASGSVGLGPELVSAQGFLALGFHPAVCRP
jgi:hypothetical protein